ncbi:MAG: hypothetical protein ACI9CE_002118 [Flavobacterium sp.]|jgi:hypothetical protein
MRRALPSTKVHDMTQITIQAGSKAYQQIKSRGLSPADISTIFGASGAAKWLAIYGLDKAIFSQWLVGIRHKIDVFGTSVGAFKLAAATQSDPAIALDNLAEAYIHQHYEGDVTTEQISIETTKILGAFLSDESIKHILNNDHLRFHCASVLCQGWLGSEHSARQKMAMIKAFALSLIGRRFHKNTLERVIFKSGEQDSAYQGLDQFKTHQVNLNEQNFTQAILSSGSIPVVMPGVTDIPGGPKGTYRDGGLLDYHPVPTNIVDVSEGLVLYPHFYTYLKEGWFDKFAPWKKVQASQLDRVVLLSPSDDFTRSLPGASIPDRKDFYTFKDNDDERIRRWTAVKERSEEIGEEFLELVNTGEIASVVTLIE